MYLNMSRSVRREIEDYRVCDNQRLPANDNYHRKVCLAENPDLIRQYYQLRNKVFSEEHGLTHEKWSKVEHDKNSKVVVCTIDGKVIGGLRILISEKGELLSEEYEGTEYVYSNLLEKVELKTGKKYAEFVDLIVDKNYRDGGIARDLIFCCIDIANLNKCFYVFYLASFLHCRLYKGALAKKGCNNVHIFRDIVWKKTAEYNYSEDHPAVVVLQ